MAVRGRSRAPSGKSPSASAERDARSSAWVWSDAAEARCPQKRPRCLSQQYLARGTVFHGFLQIKQNSLSMFEEWLPIGFCQ
jgi:hypothetical protein